MLENCKNIMHYWHQILQLNNQVFLLISKYWTVMSKSHINYRKSQTEERKSNVETILKGLWFNGLIMYSLMHIFS